MTRVYLSIGSNLGDRDSNLNQAVRELDAAIGPHLALSSFVYTPSWGFDGEEFANCAVSYQTSLLPEELLDLCKNIEKKLGRDCSVEFDPEGKRIYHNRIIDIDILLYGNEHIETECLTIPHPLMRERDFVMVPLNEILEQ